MTGLPLHLVHISDIHFGKSVYSSWFMRPRKLPTGEPLFPTWCGHDARVASDLTDWWYRFSMKGRARNVVLCHSGDLTATGHVREFINAKRYVSFRRKRLPNRVGRLYFGLHADFDAMPQVVGNHDFYGGMNHFLSMLVHRRHPQQFLERTGNVVVLEHPNKELQIHVGLVDSCSGLGAGPGKRFSACQFLSVGALHKDHLPNVAQEFANLARVAHQDGAKTVLRLAIMHHPLKTLEPASRKRFRRWADEIGLGAVLTGHVHYPGYPDDDDSPLEIRCGTTMQRPLFRTKPSKTWHNLLCHSVFYEPSSKRISWVTRSFMRRGAWPGHDKGFKAWDGDVLGLEL